MPLSLKKALGLVIATAALAVTALPLARADTLDTLYTNEAAFTAALAPGAFSGNFSGLSDSLNFVTGKPAKFTYLQSLDFGDLSGHGYGFVASVSNSFDGSEVGTTLWTIAGALSTNDARASLVFTFKGPTGSNLPTAVGGLFYTTDSTEAPVRAKITVVLGDGATDTFYTTSDSLYQFVGFTSDAKIQSLSISAPDQVEGIPSPNTPGYWAQDFAWPTTNLVIVGEAADPAAPADPVGTVPEPTAVVALLGLAGMGLLGLVWRRRRHA
jgi:hypothetical protein